MSIALKSSPVILLLLGFLVIVSSADTIFKPVDKIHSRYTSTTNCAVLLHRYSFKDVDGSSIAMDSANVYAWNGTKANAQIVGSPTDIYLSGGKIEFRGNLMTSQPHLDLGSNIMEDSETVTIELWVTTTDSNSGNSRMLHFNKDSSNPNIDDIVMWHTGYHSTLGVALRNSSHLGLVGFSPGAIEFNGMSNAHLVVVFNPAEKYIKLYSNGTLKEEAIGIHIPAIPVTQNNFLGRMPGGNHWDPAFSGWFDEVRIWRGALDIDTISEHYLLGPDILLQSESPRTEVPSEKPTAHPVQSELLCADIKDWRRKKLYPANSLVKLGVRVYEATQQNQRKKPTRDRDLWNFIANCHTSCKGVSEWRFYKLYKKGDIITDKQKKHLYKALRKSKGKSKKPGKANDDVKVYWKQIGMC